MLEIFVAALLALGFITSPDQASQEILDQNFLEVQEYIIDTDVDQM